MRILSFFIYAFIFLLSQTAPLLGQERLVGDWEGYIDVQGTKLNIITHFSHADDSLTGTIDIPQQGASGLTIETITTSVDDSVYFDFFAGTGMAEFRGHLKNDTLMNGSFHQRGQSFRFELTKRLKDKSSVKMEDTPPSYNQEELTIQNDSVAIGGTLTWPKGQPTDKLVIIISGSGAQNRDGKLPGIPFEPYAALAQSLTPNGIATFRYDDRGVGQSSGNFSETSLHMLASDVGAVVNYFRNRSSHSFSEIILLGHSQGGIVGGKVAAENQNIDKLILLASPGITLADVVINQVANLNREAGLSDSIITKRVALQKAIFDTLRGSQDFSEIENSLVQRDSLSQSGTKAKMLQTRIKQQLNSLTKPFYYSLLDYDPTQDLNQLNLPVLAVFGGKDTQVNLGMNKSPLKSALQKSGTSYQIKVFPEANHLFQKANTGSVQEYSTLESTFVDELIPTLTEWIKD